MARLGLLNHPKFKGVLRDLRDHDVNRVLLLGNLTMLWMTSWQAESPVFRDAEEVEISAEWEGEPGAFAASLEKRRFLDRLDDGTLAIHDWAQNAPNYIKDAERKRQERARKKSREKNPATPDDPENDRTRPRASVTVQDRPGHSRTQPDATGNGAPTIPFHTIPLHSEEAYNHNSREGGELTTLADIIGGEWAEKSPLEQKRELIDRLVNFPGRGDAWRPWWDDCLTRYTASGGTIWDFADLAKAVDDSHNPAKDVGTFKDPAAWITKKATQLMKARRLRWNKFPGKAVAS